MARNEMTSSIIDGVLRVGVGVGTVSVALLAPNLLKVLDGPTQKYLQSLDKRARERRLRTIIAYMQREHLLINRYQHGIEITKRGLDRLKKRDFESLTINKPEKWDKKWRLVMFDIPQEHDMGRRQLAMKLRELGYQPLQMSVWIHPFPSKEEVALVATNYDVAQYVTYMETSHIDHEDLLKKRFSHLL